ncbi:MAG: hypothetical protein KAW17_10955 [Candidatus Eisenbacteria sp.]|nr:hypothetical protein [Candidatus Eisenbacteria bacterium]
MCSVTHLAVGGVLGGWAGNSGVAFFLGIVSHVVMDAVPHYDTRDFRVDVALTAAGFLAVLGLGYWNSPVFWGAVGAVLPDVENLLWRLGAIRESWRIFPSHTRLIRHGKPLTARGAIPQVFLILGSIAGLVPLGG